MKEQRWLHVEKSIHKIANDLGIISDYCSLLNNIAMTQNSRLQERAMQDYYLAADNGRVPEVITQH